MKYFGILVSCIICILMISSTFAQQEHLNVEGNVQIKGDVDLHHPYDTTSLSIGWNAGINTDYNIDRLNTIVGSGAGRNNTIGYENSFFGRTAGLSNTEGDQNSFLGVDAGRKNTTGYRNSFLGHSSGLNNITGRDNCFVGNGAGLYGSDGKYNTYVGGSAGQLATEGSLLHAIAIGYMAKVGCDQCAVIGGTGLDAVKVGIGTATPQDYLHIHNQDGSAGIRINAQDGDTSHLKLLEGSGFGYELQYDGFTDRLYLWSRKFAGNEGIRMTWDKTGNVGFGVINPSAQLHTSGTVRFASLGSGSLQTDANGNVTVSSDLRLKDDIRPYTAGLNEIMELNPIKFKWKEHTGLDTKNIYIGFAAQNVQAAMPEAVGKDEDGYLTLSDRSIIAALVNAVKELKAENNALRAELNNLKDNSRTN